MFVWVSERTSFAVQPRRVVSETVSGSVAAMERRGFARLVDRMEEGDVLVVTKLDRRCHGNEVAVAGGAARP